MADALGDQASRSVASLTAGHMADLHDRATIAEVRGSFGAGPPGGDVSTAARSTIGLKLQGLVVDDMIVGSPAHESGVQVGDTLVEADGIQLVDIAQALRALTTPDEPGTVLLSLEPVALVHAQRADHD